MTVLLFILLLLAGAIGGIALFRRAEGPLVIRLGQALIPIVAALAIILLLIRVFQSSSQDWNEAKLAPVLAMTRGYSLYQNPDTGVMTGWIYGPVGAILLFPAAIGRDPTTVVFIGVILAVFYYLAPVAWMFWNASRGAAPLLVLLAFLVLLLESLSAEDLTRCIVFAAPDAPALGLATCACAAIYRGRSLAGLAISALTAILCVWTKQNYAPIFGALFCWVALTQGWKQSVIYLALLAGAGLAISSILLLCFGPSAMWFHMVVLPGSHPWRDEEANTVAVWLLGFHDLIYVCSSSVGLLGLVLMLSSILNPRAANVRQWFIDRPWMLCIGAATFLIPGGLIGYLKVGGHVNSLACTNFFLLLGGLAGMVELTTTLDTHSPLRRTIEMMLLCYAMVSATNSLCGSNNGLLKTWPVVIHPYENPQQQAFAYAKAHPGDIYCPWNPLTTLMADGKLYHFEWGLIDRLVAKRQPPENQLRAHIPPTLTKVVYLRPPQSTAAMSVLPQFNRQVQLQELPDCVVYTR